MNQSTQLINILNEFAKGSDHKIDFVTLQKSKTRFQIPASNNFNEFIFGDKIKVKNNLCKILKLLKQEPILLVDMI